MRIILCLFFLIACDSSPKNTEFFAEINLKKWHEAGKKINPTLENLSVTSSRDKFSVTMCLPGQKKEGKITRNPKLTVNLASMMKSPIENQGSEIFEEMKFCALQFDEID